MGISWKYKINLVDENVFTEIEKERKISFPKELKEFILETNAATPSSYNFMVGNNERVLGAILSFNRNERDTDSVFTAFSAVEDCNMIPFGIDPFGNYICYSINDNTIAYWNHETNRSESTGNTLSRFLESLY